ncbi:OmpA family protein [Hymenobacter sp. GOD-10R]|uniref:OmpA family protein n=1 Tax=Hymenobacter sp. GOD-10R TaxID=3093922 RepID=UPI002D7662A7|nr:OmpA family protein [Hymenobacter sp. GOD-10R]WRQ31281.1 OmpA family protein [Hymenobacter sp. GOD-10R]
MSKALLWWLLSFWVSGSVVTHVVYIKHIGWTETARLAPIQVINIPRRQLLLPGALFARAQTALAPTAHLPLAQTGAYLHLHPSYQLTVTGTYTRSEASATVVPDLGRSRAAAVATYLGKEGASAHQLRIRSQRDDALRFADDSTGALVFALDSVVVPPVSSPVTVQRLANTQQYISLRHPMELYFPLGSVNFLQTSQNDRFIKEAAAYLRTHPKAFLLTTTHTDSLGQTGWNLDMALARATEVKAHLTKQGIRAAQIRVEQRGAASPIAPNRTPEGRLANRRVSVVVRP